LTPIHPPAPTTNSRQDNIAGGANAYHGVGGNYPVDEVRYQNPLSKRFLDACAQMGWAQNADFNDWSRPQVGFGRFKVAQKGGRRVTAAAGYLPRSVRKRANLDIATESMVTKVVLDGDRAVGVEFMGKDGVARRANIGQGGEVRWRVSERGGVLVVVVDWRGVGRTGVCRNGPAR
jgi:choline dehydrogenase-like flavoprotein